MPLHSSSARVLTRGLLPALMGLLLAVPALAADQDGDGWAVEDGDCADVPTGQIPLPQYVNPGAYDIPGNGIDDDCDGTIDNPPSTACSTMPLFTGQSGLTLAQALDLCPTTVESPPLPSQRTWGLISAEILRASSAAVPADVQSAVMSSFGAAIVPQANATMAVISSGTARDQGDPGYTDPQSSYTSGFSESAPAAFLAANGGGVYQAPACPIVSTTVYDAVRLKLRIRVPTNANGFSFKHRYFSAEWPDVCTSFNDHLLCLLTSLSPGIPADHNILFDSMSNPMTVQTAFFGHCASCPQGTVDLTGTGYATQAATSWGTASAPVVPGETIELEFIIWDSGDGTVDGLALFDDFRWATIEQPVGCDVDGDLWAAASCGGTDCDDSNASIHPGAPELLDGLDNDCDGLVDDGFDAPLIRFVRDVKPDQGGAVRVRWRASLSERAYDPNDPLPRVTGYTLYRRIDGALAPALGQRPAGAATAAPRQVPHGDAALALPPGEWDVLTTVPATLDSVYQTVAPTLCDSSSAGICWSVFLVRALTDQVGTFYDAPLDSGYSVDDIAPGVPQGFAVQPAQGGTQLSWQPSDAPDFQYFRVYRDADPDFTPSPATLVHATATSSWTDPTMGAYTWKVTAVDAHDNESAPAAATSTVGVDGALPRALAFVAVTPNPVRGRAAFAFDVPESAGRVELALYDLAGRRVRTLVSGALPAGRHAVAWDGRGDAGARLAPGVYLARLEGAGRSMTRRVTLMP